MKYKLPPLPDPTFVDTKQACSADGTQDIVEYIHFFNDRKMRQYAEQAVAPLLAEIERLEKFISDSFEAHPNLDLDVESLNRK